MTKVQLIDWTCIAYTKQWFDKLGVVWYGHAQCDRIENVSVLFDIFSPLLICDHIMKCVLSFCDKRY